MPPTPDGLGERLREYFPVMRVSVGVPRPGGSRQPVSFAWLLARVPRVTGRTRVV